MLAEAAEPDQRAAKKMRTGHCTKKFHLGSPEVTFLGTDTSFAESHPTLQKKYLIEGQRKTSMFSFYTTIATGHFFPVNLAFPR